jgi:hypothetical protein
MSDGKRDDVAQRGADLLDEARVQDAANREVQHELLQAAADEDGAPLLETQTEIYGIVVDVSGRLTGEFVGQIEALDKEAKRRADGESEDSGVSDIIAELCVILGDTVDDPELDAEAFYQTYQENGPGPLKTIAEEVLGALQSEDERVSGQADGFRQN